NSPEISLRRHTVAVLLDAAGTASDMAADDREFNGATFKHTTATLKNGDAVSLFFNPQSKLLAGFETTDTEALDGDVPAQYILDDYKDDGGVKLPHKITIRKNNKDYSTVQYASASVNDADAPKVFDIPGAAAKEADTASAAGE